MMEAEETSSSSLGQNLDSPSLKSDGCGSQMDSEAPTQSIEDVNETKATPTELDKYWKAVHENPSDFTGWTYLLQYVEQEGKVEEARDAFDAFLLRYPYCYGYWKKYADLEKKFDNLDQTEEVFEKGVRAIPLSIDLWIHYINFMSNKLGSDDDGEAKVRQMFERALIAAGTDFRSDKLWDMYLYWEQEKKNPECITKLCDRVLCIPTQLYSHHFENFCEHVKHHHPKDILGLDEFLRVRQDVVAEKAAKETRPPEVEEGGDGEGVADDVGPPGVDTGAATDAATPKPSADTEEAPPGTEAEKAVKEDEAEIEAIKNKIIEIRRSWHKLNEQEVSRRWSYEESIRRPYFHVKPLEKAQLRNWRDYLDFEMENGTHERAVVLFERCLIACALYEEFWLKYTKYLEGHSVDAARSVFKRACATHLRKKPTVHLAWAALEERQGNCERAMEILTDLESQVPGLILVNLRRISLYRRQGQLEEAERLYKEFMDRGSDKETKSFFAIKYARFQAKVMGDTDRAKEVLRTAVEQDKTNAKLYLQLVDLEFQLCGKDHASLLHTLQKAIDSPLSIEQRVAFSQRRLDYMEDFCPTVDRLQESYEEHQKLIKEIQAQKSKKRKTKETKDESAEKKARSEVTGDGSQDKDSAPSGQPNGTEAAAAAAAAAPYPANAGGYGQGYPQAPGSYGPGYPGGPPPPPPPSQPGAYHDGSQRHGDGYNYQNAPYSYNHSWPGYHHQGNYGYQQAMSSASWSAGYGSQYYGSQ